MSIVTKTGDQGSTALMYGRRVPKTHPQVEAYGTLDELSSALGLARSFVVDAIVKAELERIQTELITLMGELATAAEDARRFEADGFRRMSAEMITGIENSIADFERQQEKLKGWALPGANPASAALDLARTICRRAERRVCGLQAQGLLSGNDAIVYLNRLADWLWLAARKVERQS